MQGRVSGGGDFPAARRREEKVFSQAWAIKNPQCCRAIGEGKALMVEPELSDGFEHFTGLNAAGANGDPPGLALNYCPDFLQIGVKAPPGTIVGVTDTVAEHRLFPANFTDLGHSPLLC